MVHAIPGSTLINEILKKPVYAYEQENNIERAKIAGMLLAAYKDHPNIANEMARRFFSPNEMGYDTEGHEYYATPENRQDNSPKVEAKWSPIIAGPPIKPPIIAGPPTSNGQYPYGYPKYPLGAPIKLPVGLTQDQLGQYLNPINNRER
jgi:hypothetical protein